MLLIAAAWKLKGLSQWWTIPALAIFGIALYGNGYIIFNPGACGLSLNKTSFFIYQTKLGDYAKADAESINLDSLNAGKYKGRLLGYALDGNILTVFRIGEAPVTVKTSFLFWKIRSNVIWNGLSNGLNTYRNLEAEKFDGHYEFIGGKGMTEDNFISEFVLTNKELSSLNFKHTRIINASDGTTRFLFETE